MGLTALRSFLKRHTRVALDTSVFIYHLEANPSYLQLATEVFSLLERSTNTAVTSTITMTELLVHAYRDGNELLVNQYFGLLSTFPNLEWIAPDLTIANTAAQFRAQYRLRTPDALQVATALLNRASAILTNDPAIKRVREIDVGVLDQLR